MDNHTVTVKFDDSGTSVDAIVAALGQAGYAVPGHTKME